MYRIFLFWFTGTVQISKYWRGLGVSVMEISATFNNISDISWRSVLLTEETGVPGENDRAVE
jgi:hypothetical protein